MKFCKNCGRELTDEATFCSGCGVAQNSSEVYSETSSAGNGLAKASSICGIVGLFCIPAASLVAIILAIIAKKKGATRSNGLVTGIIGLVLGTISYIIFYIFYFALIFSMY